MKHVLNRCEFLGGSVSAAAVLGLASRPKSSYRLKPSSSFRKAVIANKPDEQILRIDHVQISSPPLNFFLRNFDNNYRGRFPEVSGAEINR